MDAKQKIVTNKNKHYIGIFFADDKIIMGGFRTSKATKLDNPYADFNAQWENRENSPHVWVEKIEFEGQTFVNKTASVKSILDKNINLYEQVYMIVAFPGPVDQNGVLDPLHRDKNLREKNLKLFFERRVMKPDSIIFIHDASAFCFGVDNTLNRTRNPSNTQDIIMAIILDEGIGGAVMVDGVPRRRKVNPEFGHMIVLRHPDEIDVPTSCDSHYAPCAEGYASLRALRERHNLSFEDYKTLKEGDPVLEKTAFYLAQVFFNAIYSMTPDEICIVGRMIENPYLIKRVKEFLFRLRQPRQLDPSLTHHDMRRMDIFLTNLEPRIMTCNAESTDLGVKGCIQYAIWSDISKPEPVESIQSKARVRR